ncbi:MAG: preprotein translocase subunit SecE [Pirellulales bacterium]|nr:preprotein translocase subunit SecE [Pirellulales bacterium]
MAEKKEALAPSVFAELFQFGLYKRSQGRIMRQATFFGLLAFFLALAWRLPPYFGYDAGSTYWSMFFAISAVGAWLSYRVVNIPRFADFLINVEGEFNKISWPTQAELLRSSVVVIFVMLAMALLLWFFDTVWFGLFRLIGVIHS